MYNIYVGLIEELRRKKAEKEELGRQRALIGQNQRRAQARQQEKIELEKSVLRGLREEAEKRFQESGLWAIIEEVSELGGGSPWQYGDDSKGIYKCGIIISRKKIPDKYWTGDETGGGVIESKTVKIEIDSQGTMQFKGGIFGSSTVEQSVWQRDKNMLEKALGKAYNNPKTEREKYYPKDGYNPFNQGIGGT